MHCLTRVAAIGAFFASCVTVAAAQDRNIVWEKRVENTSQAQLAQQDFLLTLFNTGRMPFRDVPMGDHLTPEEVMRANGAWIGPLTEQIATLLCQMNDNRCDLTPSDANRGKDVQSVAGVFAKPERWTVRPTDSITIPDVRIIQISRPEPASRSAKVEANDFRILRVCLTDALCFDDYVTEPNQPLGRLRDTIVATRPTSKAAFPLRLVPHLAATVNVSEQPTATYDALRANSPANFDFSDTKFQRFNERLSKDLIAPIELQLEANHGAGLLANYGLEPLAQHQKVILDSFCNVVVHGKCPEFVLNDISRTIGVIDQMPESHCDFGDNIQLLDIDAPEDADTSLSAAATVDCDSDVRGVDQVLVRHHGTHVLGLLAAKQNDRGVGGLLGDVPSISYLVIPFDEATDLQANTSTPRRLADAINRAIINGVKIFNLSFSYRQTNEAEKDPVLEIIRNNQEEILFVAAAGRDGVNAEGGTCPAKPACYARSMPNIIGVVGLEGTLDKIELLKDDVQPDQFRTNFGFSTFAIGAPARDIVSTIATGAFGPMTGSSQATPQVTAAAALLMFSGNLSPSETRERLIYSSRLSTDTVNQLQGGAVDASAALLDKDLIRLDDGCVLLGDVRNFKRHIGEEWKEGKFNLKLIGSGAVLKEPIGEVRRMHWAGDEGIFFYLDDHDRLARAHASFDDNPDPYHIHFKVEAFSESCGDTIDEGVHHVQLSRIVDFIASAQ